MLPFRRLGQPGSALLLGLLLFVVYNANGREIGSVDTQPTKFAARALVLTGSLAVDRDVERQPLFADRVSFVLDQAGHYRSAYSPVEPILGAVVAWVLMNGAYVDLDAEFSANLIAVLTASLLTSGAVVLVFLTVRRIWSAPTAWWVAIGLGLGTNLWAAASQTMGQHDAVAFGLAVMVFAWTRDTATLTRSMLWAGAGGLALATTARFQTLPLAGVVGLSLLVRVGWRRAAVPLLLIAGSLLALALVQWYWFGNVLGAAPLLEALHPQIHGVDNSLSRTPWRGAAGLLWSPNRGLLVFSPIVVLGLAGMRFARSSLADIGGRWLAIAILAQFAAYATYSVWWGGHTYGPRYLIDLLIPLSIFAAAETDRWLRRASLRRIAATALAWSIVVAGTGAFYANPWNSQDDVDEHHERLWDWRDWQISTAWHAGLSSQNFALFHVSGFRPRPVEKSNPPPTPSKRRRHCCTGSLS